MNEQVIDPMHSQPSSIAAPTPETAPPLPLLAPLLLLATVQLMMVLDNTIINVAIPTIQKSVGFSVGSISWVVNGYVLAFGALLLLGGRSGDLLGRRSVLVVALAAFAAASLAGGLTSSEGVMIAARIVQGAAAAFAQANALSLIVSTFPSGPSRNRALAVFSAMEGIGASAGLLLGGFLVEAVSWRWVFFVNVPVAVILAVLAPRFLPQPVRQSNRLDIPGAVTASAGLGLSVFGLSRAAEHGWTDLWTLGPIAAGVTLLAAFWLLEGRSSNPLMPRWIFRDRNRAGANIMQILIGGGLFGMFFLLTQFFQNVLGYGALKSGVAFLPATVGIIIAAAVVSQVVARVGVRPLATSGAALTSVGLFLMSRLNPDTTYLTGILPAMVVLAIGLGLVFVPMSISAVSGVDEERSGIVSGVSMTSIQIGGAIGVAILATVSTQTINDRLAAAAPVREALSNGYTDAFRIAALIVAAAVPVAYGFLRLRPNGAVVQS